MIGDPTDKPATRKQLSREEVLKNTRTWKEQASRILDFAGPNKAEFKFNSEWLARLTPAELVNICSKLTVPQLIEREMFQKRLKGEGTVYAHEFLYPIFQGYDSVAMNVDLEVGGSDQIFNMLVGRTLMAALKGREKYVLATKLLVDKEGNKVGKTTGNALFLDSTPENFYAGVMAFPDETILLGFELLTDVNLEGLAADIQNNPMRQKKRLSFAIVRLLWGEAAARKAENYFENTFQEKSPDFDIKVSAGETLAVTISPFTPLNSLSDAKRLIKQGGVDVNGTTVKDPALKIRVGDKIKVGQRTFLKAAK
jgi:tyrosyl-tRNA synthetase